MSSRLREYNVFFLICVAIAWVVVAERSEEWDFVDDQIEQRHSTLGGTDLIQLDECSKEVISPGDHEKTGDEAVLHCCGTENVVGWHQHLKEKARDLSKQGLTITEPHDHRASSINLKKQMEMNDYVSLVHGCDYCKCPEDIAKAAIDLHKQTSKANNDYLDRMLHGGSQLGDEYKHIAHLSNLFGSMANNMSIKGTIDTANHAIDLSQEVARLTKAYKDRMAMMSLGGHAFLNNLTAFSENPAYQTVRSKVEEWETLPDGKRKKPSREINSRTLRTQVERLGILSEHPDSSYKYYKIIPTELRESKGKLAQVAGWKFLAQDGTNLEGKYHCDSAVNEDFAGLTFAFQDHVKLGKIAYLPSSDPNKDILRFSLFGSQDNKLWKPLFNAVVDPPVASPPTARNTDVWVSIAYNELTPENTPDGD